MAGDGLDDELLALAGDSDDDRRKKSTSASASAAVDNDDVDGDRVRGSYSSRKRSSGKSSSIAKKRRLELLNDSASSDGDQDAPGSDENSEEDAEGDQDKETANPYPYQGLYKNHKDMDQLMRMNELEREGILSRRRDEINKRRQKHELAALLRSQRAAAGATKKKAAKVVQKKAKTSSKKKRKSESDLDQSSDDQDNVVDQDADSDMDAEGSDYSANFTSTVSSAAKARRKNAVGSSETKTAKLSELRKKRKEKASGIRHHDSDEATLSPKKKDGKGYLSSDSDGGFSADDYESDDGYSKRKTSNRKARSGRGRDRDRDDHDTAKKEPPSLADLNAVRISRDTIEQKLYAPKWKETLIGSFIRFSWGMRDRDDGRGKEQVYRIHQITDVTEKPGKFYDHSNSDSGKWTNVYLTFEHLGNEYEASLNMLSRSDFTEGERDRWLRTMASSDQHMPRKWELEEKAEQLETFFSATLTEADIQRILSVKKKLKQEAKDAGYGNRNRLIQNQNTPGIDSPARGGSGTATPTKQYDQHVMAQVNDRNRRHDKERIAENERRAAQAKKAALQQLQLQQQQSQLTQATENGNSEQTKDTVQPSLSASTSTPTFGLLVPQTSSITSAAALRIDVDLGDF